MLELDKIATININTLECELEDFISCSTTRLGAWNADYSKQYVFNIELKESTLQYEQDYADTYYPYNADHITAAAESLLHSPYQASGKTVYNISIEEVLKFLILNNIIEDVKEVMVGTIF